MNKDLVSTTFLKESNGNIGGCQLTKCNYEKLFADRYTNNDVEYEKAAKTITQQAICISPWKNEYPTKYVKNAEKHNVNKVFTSFLKEDDGNIGCQLIKCNYDELFADRYTNNDVEYEKAEKTITQQAICISPWKNLQDEYPTKYVNAERHNVNRNWNRRHNHNNGRWESNRREKYRDFGRNNSKC